MTDRNPQTVITTANLGAYIAGGPYGTKYDATIPAGTQGTELGPWPENPIGYSHAWRLIRVVHDGLPFDIPAIEGDHYQPLGLGAKLTP